MPLSHPSSNSVSSNDTDRGDEHKLLSERGRELSRNINLEDVLEREERMEILGAVSGVMVKKPIDGVLLDVNGCFPPIPNIVDFLHRFRAGVDLFLCKNRTFVNYTDTPDMSDKVPKECGFCQKKGHNESNCFKKLPCGTCNQIGHGEKYCRNSVQKNCGKCGRAGHKSADCSSRCNPRNVYHFSKKIIPSQCADNNTVDNINTLKSGLSLQFDNSNIVEFEHDLSSPVQFW